MDFIAKNTNGHQNGHAPEMAAVHALNQEEARLAIEDAVRDILINVGENPDRSGLEGTPNRVARAYGELLEGYTKTAEDIIGKAMFDVPYGDSEMVVVQDIEYNSLCEHHMLPFIGKAHIAYIPGEKVVGLSKIPRIVDMFARRLQVQERLTNEVADTLSGAVGAHGVMVVVEGQHSCAALRGVKKHGVNMVTTAARGAFRDEPALRTEFYQLIGK